MLSFERKKTDKVEIFKPLYDYIRNQYGAEAAADHQEALNNVQQLREDVRNIQDKTETARDILLRYYGLLNSIEMRFPISENHVLYSSAMSLIEYF